MCRPIFLYAQYCGYSLAVPAYTSLRRNFILALPEPVVLGTVLAKQATCLIVLYPMIIITATHPMYIFQGGWVYFINWATAGFKWQPGQPAEPLVLPYR